MKSLLSLTLAAALTAQACLAQALSARAAARFLDQATWGPTPASIAYLQNIGIEKWLAFQFDMNRSDLPDQPILNAAGQSNNNLGPVQAAFFQNTVSGEDQLRQREAFILSQIWVVSATSGVPNAYAYPPYWRIFRDNAFGNYRDVIKAVTHEEVTKEDLGGASAHASKSGVCHLTSPDDKTCLAQTRELLSFLPSNNQEDPPRKPTDDPPTREVQELDTFWRLRYRNRP